MQQLSVTEALRRAILEALPDAQVQVEGGGGHYQIAVKSSAFEGKSRVESQRIVYRAIAPFMSGEQAPVHAVDSLRTSC